MNDEYEVKVLDLPEYEELVAEIYFGNAFAGLLSQEGGPDETVFEIAPTTLPLKVDLETFEKALAHAKRRLWDLRRRRE